MTKKNILTILLDSIFIIAFNIVFFINLKENQLASVWICYGFLHFAYLMVLLTPIIESKEYLSKLSTYAISMVYFTIEMIFMLLVLFIVNSCSATAILSVQVVFSAIYLVLLISNLLTNDAIANKQARHEIENNFIKNSSAKLKYIESIITNEKLKNKVNNLYYTIHTSPVKTCNEVSVYEEKIDTLLCDLEKIASENDEIKISEQIIEIEKLINKRNFILKSK